MASKESDYDDYSDEEEKTPDVVKNVKEHEMEHSKKIMSLKNSVKGSIEKNHKNYGEKIKKLIEKVNTVNVTNTNVHAAYAHYRIVKSDDEIHWPLLMMKINHYINSSNYPRKTLFTELTIPMIELCLNVPIQVDLIRNGEAIKLGNPGIINYDDKCFENAIEIIIDLLNLNIITKEDLRIPYEFIEKRTLKMA